MRMFETQESARPTSGRKRDQGLLKMGRLGSDNARHLLAYQSRVARHKMGADQLTCLRSFQRVEMKVTAQNGANREWLIELC